MRTVGFEEEVWKPFAPNAVCLLCVSKNEGSAAYTLLNKYSTQHEQLEESYFISEMRMCPFRVTFVYSLPKTLVMFHERCHSSRNQKLHRKLKI